MFRMPSSILHQRLVEVVEDKYYLRILLYQQEIGARRFQLRPLHPPPPTHLVGVICQENSPTSDDVYGIKFMQNEEEQGSNHLLF